VLQKIRPHGRVLRRRHQGLEERSIELTWQSGIAFVYDKTTFQPRRRFNYLGEGLGLTHDDVNLIMSDGDRRLRLLDPATFAERRRIQSRPAACRSEPKTGVRQARSSRTSGRPESDAHCA